MKFKVSRTSTYDGQPCDEAYQSYIEYWHIRSCTESEFNERFSAREGMWMAKGKNHHITKEGYISRQEEDRRVWCVDLNGLDDVLAFAEKYGSIIIGTGVIPEVEIYDDYRE